MTRHGFNRGSVRLRALHPDAIDRGSVRGVVHERGSPRPAASHWCERTTDRELPPIGWRIGAGRRVTPFEPAVSWPLGSGRLLHSGEGDLPKRGIGSVGKIPQIGELIPSWNGDGVFTGREPHNTHKR